MSAHTSFDCNTVTRFALAVTVLGQHSSCIMLSAAQTCQIAPILTGDTFILVAISGHSCHCEKLSQSFVKVPPHGGHIVATA